MAEEIPVQLFTGFMDSCKTSLIKDTICENDFANGSKGLIIMCEDGDVEYDMDKLKAANIQVCLLYTSVKVVGNRYAHVGYVSEGMIRTGEKATLAVDTKTRTNTCRCV